MKFVFCRMASAVPLYQLLPSCCCAGTSSMNWSRRELNMFQPVFRWFEREYDLYCVRTKIRLRPEFTQFERVKSMILKIPPKGTAGFARTSVRGRSRSPCPPAITKVRVSSIASPLAGAPAARPFRVA